MERFDVAIVGAGPAGSSSAISLARKGYSVLLLDKALFPREKLCGDFLNPINWPLFERLGVAGKLFSLEHEEVTAFRISTFSGQEATIRFPSQNGRRPFGFGLSRRDLDDLLLRAAEKAGAVVRQGCRAREIEPEKGGWSFMLGHHPAEQRVRATVLIGADGRNSSVAHRFGLVQPSASLGRFLAFQLQLRGAKRVMGEVQIHLFPGGYAGLVGLGGEVANLCFTVEKERARKDVSVEALFENCLYRNPRLREALREGEVVGGVRSAYPVYYLPRRSCGDGFLLVGDAARVTEPVTGEGVYFALKSGELAAEAVDLAFSKGSFSARQFAGYQHVCQRVFSLRQRVNGLIRALVYRPSLLKPLIRLSSKTSFPIRSLVNFVCAA
jgi:geranylgeranyl reductase family protein